MNGMVCDCGCYGGGGRHWTFFLLRTLFTIIILMVVFWFGVMAGRIGDGSYGYRMMRGYGYYAYPNEVYNDNGSGGVVMPMMPIRGATSTPTTGGVQNY